MRSVLHVSRLIALTIVVSLAPLPRRGSIADGGSGHVGPDAVI